MNWAKENSIILGAVGLIGFTVLIAFWPDWDWWLNLSEVVNGLLIGIGTLLAGYGALPYFRDLNRKDKKKEQYKDKYMKLFASHLRDREKALIWKLKDSNKIFGIYIPDKTRHHIRPWGTYRDLGFESGDWDKEVDKTELEQYKEAEPIDFS